MPPPPADVLFLAKLVNATSQTTRPRSENPNLTSLCRGPNLRCGECGACKACSSCTAAAVTQPHTAATCRGHHSHSNHDLGVANLAIGRTSGLRQHLGVQNCAACMHTGQGKQGSPSSLQQRAHSCATNREGDGTHTWGGILQDPVHLRAHLRSLFAAPPAAALLTVDSLGQRRDLVLAEGVTALRRPWSHLPHISQFTLLVLRLTKGTKRWL